MHGATGGWGPSGVPDTIAWPQYARTGVVERRRARMWPDGWTAVTADQRRTAQFEHTVLVTDDGGEILTVPSGTEPSAGPSAAAGHPYWAG